MNILGRRDPQEHLTDPAALLSWAELAWVLDDTKAAGVALACRATPVLNPGAAPPLPDEQGGCGWLFLDRRRNASRRGCWMAGGTEVKARRLTERRRAARS